MRSAVIGPSFPGNPGYTDCSPGEGAPARGSNFVRRRIHGPSQVEVIATLAKEEEATRRNAKEKRQRDLAKMVNEGLGNRPLPEAPVFVTTPSDDRVQRILNDAALAPAEKTRLLKELSAGSK